MDLYATSNISIPATPPQTSTFSNPGSLPDPAQYTAPEQFDVVVFIIHLIIFFISLIGNSLAFMALVTRRGTMYPWFFNLVAADLMKTLTCMPYTLYVLRTPLYRTEFSENNPTSQFDCTFFGFIFELTLFVGLISHVGIALDRIYATYFPFKYSQNMATSSPLWVIFIVWGLMFLFCCLILITGYFVGSETKDQYRMEPFVPMCTFSIKEVVQIFIEGHMEQAIFATVFYCIMYGVPLLLICLSTILVSYKLVPPVLKERKARKAAKTALTSITYSNTGALNTTGGGVSFVSAVEPSVDILHANSEQRADVPHLERTVTDKLLMLDNNQKCNRVRTHSQNQMRAVVTMIMVSTTFLVCHALHFIYWTFFDVGKFTKLVGTGFLECAIMTFQITFAYLDAPLNVMVYYNRCSFIKEKMLRTVKTLAVKCGVMDRAKLNTC